MKIAEIKAFRVHPKAIKEAWDKDDYVWPSRPPSFIVRVTTDQGEHGVGEATSQVWYLGETAEQIESCLALYDEALRGCDPENIALAHHLMNSWYSGGMPGGRTARSAVDMALYDLVGKVRGVPVYKLLGGALRTKFDLLTNLYYKTPEEMAEGCRSFCAAGFRGLKIKVGDVMIKKGFALAHLEEELRKLEAALDVTPSDVFIDADANQGWRNAQWTVAKLRRYARHDNLSMEQPLHYADVSGARFVRANGGVPLILDESVWSPEAMLELIRMEACDRIVLKLNRVGGFYPAQHIVAMCSAAGIGVSVDTNPYNLVGDTAGCHIAATIPDHYPVDCEGHVTFLDIGDRSVFQGGITFKEGRAELPDAPGLGVTVDWMKLESLSRSR